MLSENFLGWNGDHIFANRDRRNPRLGASRGAEAEYHPYKVDRSPWRLERVWDGSQSPLRRVLSLSAGGTGLWLLTGSLFRRAIFRLFLMFAHVRISIIEMILIPASERENSQGAA